MSFALWRFCNLALLVIFLDLLNPGSAFAEDIRTLVLPNESSHEFRIKRGTTPDGELEIQVEHVEARRLLPDSHFTVLWGRDLNQDGYADAWFYHGESGAIEAVDYPSRQHDGWDAAAAVLVDRVDLSNRWYIGLALQSIFSVSWTVSASAELQSNHLVRQLDLRAFEIHLGRLARISPAAPGLAHGYATVASEWEALSKEASDLLFKGNRKNLMVDVAGQFMGAAVIRGFNMGVRYAGSRLVSTEIGTAIYQKYLTGLTSQASKFRSLFRGRPALVAQAQTVGGSAASAAALRFARMSAQQKVRVSLQAMNSAAKVAQKMAKSGAVQVGQVAKVGVKAGLKKSDYVVRSALVQIGAEIATRPEVWNDGILMVPKNLLTSDGFFQNFTYMTWETFLLTALHTTVAGTSKRLMIGGAIAISNSMIFNYILLRKSDHERVALDTTWEVAIGNVQVLADNEAENYFERLANRSNNPRIKRIGWAFGVVDQTAGYLAYSCLTQALQRKQDGLSQDSTRLPDRACDWGINKGVNAAQATADAIAQAAGKGAEVFNIYTPK